MGRRKLIEDDQLLAKARDIFVKEGINVSSRKIAKEIGLSNSVLFQRFGSKEELLFAAMTPPPPDMSAIMEKGGNRGDIPAQLEQTIMRLLAYFRELIVVLVPLATHPSFRFEDYRKRYPNSPLEQLTAELMTVWEEKHSTGEINCSDIGPFILHLLSTTYGLAMFEWIGVHGDKKFDRRMIRDLAFLLWHGISPTSQRQPHHKSKKHRIRKV